MGVIDNTSPLKLNNSLASSCLHWMWSVEAKLKAAALSTVYRGGTCLSKP